MAPLAEHHLNGLGFGQGMGIEQIMDGPITGDKGQTVGHFKTLLAEGALLALPGEAQGGFVDQLQGEARFDFGGVFAGPSAQQVPGAQAQMFGDEQPDADEIAQDLVAQQLSEGPLDASWVSGFRAPGLFGALGVNQPRLGGGERDMEFFFEDRSR